MPPRERVCVRCKPVRRKLVEPERLAIFPNTNICGACAAEVEARTARSNRQPVKNQLVLTLTGADRANLWPSNIQVPRQLDDEPRHRESLGIFSYAQPKRKAALKTAMSDNEV